MSKYFDGPDNVGDCTATGKFGDDVVEALKTWASDSETSKMFKSFVDEVARVKVGCNKDVGLTSDLIGFRVWKGLALVETDARIDGGIKLHFSSDSNVAISESSESFLNDVDSGIFASAAECGEGEHGDTMLGWKEFLGRRMSLLDDFVKLFGAGVFAGGHVGEKVEFGVAAHNY